MSLFFSLAVSLSHVHMRARTHGSSSAHTLVHPHQPAGARVSVVCNPPPGLIPLNRPHPRVVGAVSAILVPPTPHAQVLHPSRGFDTRTMAHVYTRTRMSRARQHEGSIVSVNARVCARSRVERCSKSRWKLEGRSRRWKVEGSYRRSRDGREGERRAYFRIQRTRRRRGRRSSGRRRGGKRGVVSRNVEGGEPT